MTRDEWKFNKFVDRIRIRYGELFKSLLKIQLIAKKITSEKEWDAVFENTIAFVFQSDTYISNQQKTDALLSKINNVTSIGEVVGKYVSQRWVYEHILSMTEEEIMVEKDRIAEEAAEASKLNKGSDEGDME